MKNKNKIPTYHQLFKKTINNLTFFCMLWMLSISNNEVLNAFVFQWRQTTEEVWENGLPDISSQDIFSQDISSQPYRHMTNRHADINHPLPYPPPKNTDFVLPGYYSFLVWIPHISAYFGSSLHQFLSNACSRHFLRPFLKNFWVLQFLEQRTHPPPMLLQLHSHEI